MKIKPLSCFFFCGTGCSQRGSHNSHTRPVVCVRSLRILSTLFPGEETVKADLIPFHFPCNRSEGGAIRNYLNLFRWNCTQFLRLCPVLQK